MSIRIDSASLIAGAVIIGAVGLGVLGSAVPSAGDAGPSVIYNDLTLPADAGTEVRAKVTAWPASGTLFVYEDGSFEYSGPSDAFSYQLYANGVAIGSPAVVTLTVGTPATPASGSLKVWNGSAWVAATLKVWNGSAWVTATLKSWNGSAWV